MQTYVDTLITRHVKLCSIDLAKVLKEGAMLSDSLELAKSVRKELEAQSSTQQFVESAGVVIIVTSLVTDIIMDAYSETAGKINPLFKVLTKVHDKAKEGKWKGNIYEKEIENIKKGGGVLEQLAKLDKTGMIAMTVTIHKDMLANAVGLMGHMESSRQSRMVLVNALKSLQNNIEKLEKQRSNNQFYLEHGEGAPPQQRFTPARTAPPLA